MRFLLRRLNSIQKVILASISTNNSCELLKDRTVLTVKRESCCDFLQGLITNDVGSFASTNCMYTMLLNSSGRVLYDAFIYKTNDCDEFHFEVSSDISAALTRHLKMFSLRKKIVVSTSQLLPWAVFQNIPDNPQLVPDPRCRQPLVFRCLSETQPVEQVVDGNYSLLRYNLGLAEGSSEIPVGEGFPLEYNADFLNAVSFNKGCYVGQELTARVHHTGVVRKRIMPLELSGVPDETSDFSEPVIDLETKKVAGKIRGVTGNRALALMRITESVSSKGLYWNKLNVKVTIPKWWPPLKESAMSRL